ncbi:MAG: carboxypeptidase regulatory-like domain-containing protein [Dehalococcoidia bacterium]
MTKRVFMIGMGCLLSMLAGTAVWGYEAVAVSNGGSVSGQVTFSGEVPPPQTIRVTKNTDVCGQTIPSETLLVSADKGIKNVIVTFENIQQGKEGKPRQVVINNHLCRFEPRVQAVMKVKGFNVVVKNDDDVLHNTHAYQKKRTVFNLALPTQGQTIKVTRKIRRRTGMVEIKCDAHDWMHSWLLVTDHPYVAVTDENGGFKIADIPPGTYTLRFWHEALGTQQQEVTITAGSDTQANIAFAAK